MVIAGKIPSTLVDFPQKVACSLFVPGCNFDCFYCHNRQLIDGSEAPLDMQNIWSFLKKRVGQLDGVVITGGEPTLQNDLIPFVREIKALGYAVKIDTNGSNPGVIAQLAAMKLCDSVAVDYKAPLMRYPEICGGKADGQTVLQTIDVLVSLDADFEVRTTMIPQLTLKDLVVMANELPIVPRYVLNRYRRPEKFKGPDGARVDEKPYTQAEIEEFAKQLRRIQPNIIA